MGEFGDLVGEAVRGGSRGMPPGPGEASLDERVAAIDTRARTETTLFWVGAAIMGVFGVVMRILLLTADDATSAQVLVTYGSLFVFAGVALAMLKLWHFRSISDARLLKEVLRIQYPLETDRPRREPPQGEPS